LQYKNNFSLAAIITGWLWLQNEGFCIISVSCYNKAFSSDVMMIIIAMQRAKEKVA